MNPSASILSTKKAAVLSQKVKYNFGLASSFINSGNSNIILGNYKEALSYFQKAEKSFENQLSDTDLISFLDGLRVSRVRNDWWEELSIAQKKQVLAGLKNAEEGKLMDSKKFWKSLSNA